MICKVFEEKSLNLITVIESGELLNKGDVIEPENSPLHYTVTKKMLLLYKDEPPALNIFVKHINYRNMFTKLFSLLR